MSVHVAGKVRPPMRIQGTASIPYDSFKYSSSMYPSYIFKSKGKYSDRPTVVEYEETLIFEGLHLRLCPK